MIFKTLRHIMRAVARAHTYLYRRGSEAENAFDRVVMFGVAYPAFYAHQLLFRIVWPMQQRQTARIQQRIDSLRARLDRAS